MRYIGFKFKLVWKLWRLGMEPKCQGIYRIGLRSKINVSREREREILGSPTKIFQREKGGGVI